MMIGVVQSHSFKIKLLKQAVLVYVSADISLMFPAQFIKEPMHD